MERRQPLTGYSVHAANERTRFGDQQAGSDRQTDERDIFTRGIQQAQSYRDGSVQRDITHNPTQISFQHGTVQHRYFHTGVPQHDIPQAGMPQTGGATPAGHHPGLLQHSGHNQREVTAVMLQNDGPQPGGPQAGIPQYRSHSQGGMLVGMSHNEWPQLGMPHHRGTPDGMPQYRCLNQGGTQSDIPKNGESQLGLTHHGGVEPGGPKSDLTQHRDFTQVDLHDGMPQNCTSQQRGSNQGWKPAVLPQNDWPETDLSSHGVLHTSMNQNRGLKQGIQQNKGHELGIYQHGGAPPGGGPAVMPHHGGGPAVMPHHGGGPAVMPHHGGGPAGMPHHGGGPAGMPHHGGGPAGMPHPGGGPAGMPHPGGGPAGMPHPGGGPAGMPHPGGGPAGMPLPGGGPAGMPLPGGGPAGMPLPGGGPAGMPHPGGGPAGMPHPGGGPAGSYLHGGPQAVFQQQQTLANAPPHHNTFHCRAPMSGISQPNHSQLFPTPPRSSPYLSATDTVKDFDCFPHPMTRNINNSAFPLPAIGSTHGNAFKESDGGVSDLQRHPNNVQHFLHQDTLNMQREGISVYQNIFEVQREESHVRKDGSSPQMDPLTPSERASMQNDGQFTQQDTLRERCGDVFLQKDRPNMQSGVAFLPQNITSMLHDGHMEEHDRPNMQIESPFMHHNKQGDGMGNFVDNRPSDVFQQWLSTFLSHRGKKCIPKSEPARAPSVKEAKELIYGALQLVFQLNALCQRLESSSAAEESWSQDYPKAASARRELESKMKELEKPGYIDGLKRKLGRIRKKRLRQKQARQETDEDKEVAEQAAEKEAKIDSWRMQCIQEVEEKKRERELKAVADGVLSEVRKKQADTRKMLDVLRSLEKLRKLRKEAAGRKGVFPPPSADKTFEDHIQRLRTLVNKRTALYDVEERALRVIVEGELEEERQRHQEKRQKKEREKLLQQQREVDSILFGDSDPLPPLHPLHPFRQYYLQAEHSVVSLVQIRNEWDQFLAPSDHPDASSIPRGWVLPQLPTSDIWTTALQQAE